LLRGALVSVVLLWVVGVGTSLLLVHGHLVNAESAIEDGRVALTEADLVAANASFGAAEAEAASGLRHLRAPHVRIVAAVPVVGEPIQMLDAIAESLFEVGGSVRGLLEAVEELPEGLDSLRPREGAIPVDAIEELSPHLSALASELRLAVTRVRDARSDFVPDLVAREGDRFLALADPAAASAARGAALAEHLPAFLGSHEPRRYVYVAANPAEPRGTGGYLGSYAVIEIDRGAFEIGDWRPAYDLEPRPARDVFPPNTSYARRYAAYGGAGFWQNINMTPDFPSAASAIVRLWEEVHGQSVDGVISVDPFALEALLEVAGPISVEGRTVDAENVVPYLTNEAYDELGEGSERQEIIGEVASAALETYLQTPDIEALAQAIDPMSRAVSGGHLLLHSADLDIQRGFVSAALEGGFDHGNGDVFGVALNDGSATKLDFYGQRSLDYEVRLLRHGRASGRLDLTIQNDAPTEGRSRHIIGSNVSGLEPGEMRLLSSVFCSPNCRIAESSEGNEGSFEISREQGFVFADRWLQIPSGERRTLSYVLETDEAWEATAGTIFYRLSYDDQVTVRPSPVRVRVHIPEGFEPVGLPEGARVEDRSVLWERDGERGDVELEFRFEPTA
jgi:hypothetical protein